MEIIVSFLYTRRVSITLAGLVFMVAACLVLPELNYQLLPDLEDPAFLVRFEKRESVPAEDLFAIIEALSQVSNVEQVEVELKGNKCRILIRTSREADQDNIQFILQEQLNDVLTANDWTSDHPVVAKREIHNMPLAIVHLLSTEEELPAESEIRSLFRKIPGAGKIDISGCAEVSFRIIPDRNKLANHNITVQDVITWLTQWQTEEFTVEHENNQWVFSFAGKPVSWIADQEILPGIRFAEIAEILPVKKYPNGAIFKNGTPAVSVEIFQRPGGSAFALADSVKSAVDRINDSAFSFIAEVYKNQSAVLTSNLKSLCITLILAIVSSQVVILLYTGSLRFGLVVLITVILSFSISILGVFLTGLSINIFTLGGAIIGVGLLVDNPIVAAEALFASRARLTIARTVKILSNSSPALLISNLTTLLAFVPVLFQGRLSFSIFFAVFVFLCLALLSSYLLSFTVLPLVWLNFNNQHEKKTPVPFLVNFVSTHAKAIVLCAIFLTFGSLLTLMDLRKEWMPEIESRFFTALLNSAHPVNNDFVNHVDFIEENSHVREVELAIPAKYYSDNTGNRYKASGNPYSHLFSSDRSTYRWYPASTPPGKLWREQGTELRQRFIIKNDLSGSAKLSDLAQRLTIDETEINIGVNKTINHMSRGSSLITFMKAVETPQRMDADGMFKRITASFLNTHKLNESRIIQDHGNAILEYNSQFWISFGVVLLLSIAGLQFYFRSWLFVLIIMAVIPIGISGSLLILYLFDDTINLLSVMATYITLGIALNDAVLKVDAFRNKILEGVSFIQAIECACRTRFRPILLTSITTLVCCCSMLFLESQASTIQRSMALVIIGGILFATLAAVLVIPALLFLFKKQIMD